MDWILIIGVFIGAFAGSLLADLLPQYVISPLRNRSEHKQLLDREIFQQQWGSNPLLFFIKHDGLNRPGNNKHRGR